MKLTVHSNAGKILRRFNRLPEAQQRGARMGLQRRLIIVEDRVRRGTQIKSRRGAGGVMGRLTSFARNHRLLGLDAAIGFRKTKGFPYELAQEFGARAKPGGAIAVPVTKEAKRAGSPRNFPKPLRLVIGMGKALLVQDDELATHLQYVLVKSLKPRLGFRKTVIASMDYISDGVVQGLKEGMQQV